MKVLHVINNLGSGGAESMLVSFFNTISYEDSKFEILLLIDNKISYQNIDSGVKVNLLSNSKRRYSIIKFLKLIRFINRNNFDIVQSHLFPSQYYVLFAKFFVKNKIKLVTTEHNISNNRRKYVITKFFDNFIYRFYDEIIFISKGVKNQFNYDFPNIKNKGVLINNGIPLERFRNKSTIVFNNSKKILMVARFTKQKDHITLIKSMLHLEKDYILNLIGEGENLSFLKDQVNYLGLKDRVNFLGFRSDIENVYKENSIFVLSSNWEGFGLVVVEAMACGIPVIASNIEGLKDVVEGAGLLFEPYNELMLAQLISNVENDKELRMDLIKKGYERAESFDINTLVKKTFDVYKKLLE